MSTLEALALTVRRGGRAILGDVSLRAKGGEFIAVIGANGAGKSTLLSVLAGLLAPDEGHVALDGKTLAAFAGRDLAQRRAYLPQNPRCEWPISVERLVALGLTPVLPTFGPLPAPHRDRIAKQLALSDLESQRDQPATTLSCGELARAMLARALIGEPDILIVDEPVAGLDPRHALDTMARLRRFCSAGKIVMASIHDLTLAARHATRIVALHHGRLVADGPTAEVMTPTLLQLVFEVEALVVGTGATAYIDFRPE